MFIAGGNLGHSAVYAVDAPVQPFRSITNGRVLKDMICLLVRRWNSFFFAKMLLDALCNVKDSSLAHLSML